MTKHTNNTDKNNESIRYTIEITQDDEKKWSWALWSPNSIEIAKSSRSFNRRNDLTKTLKTIRKHIGTARVIQQRDIDA